MWKFFVDTVFPHSEADEQECDEDALVKEVKQLEKSRAHHLSSSDPASHAGDERSTAECSHPAIKKERSTTWVGQQVDVIGGRNKGKCGLVLEESRKNTFLLELTDGSQVTVRIQSIQKASAPLPDNVSPSHSEDRSPSKPKPDSAPAAPRARRPATRQSTRASRAKDRERALAASSENAKVGAAWRVQNHGDGGLKFGGHSLAKVRLASNDAESNKKSEITLLSTLLGTRVLVCDVSLSGRSNQRPFELSFEEYGSAFELVSAKIYDDRDSASIYAKPKLARVVYAQIQGPQSSAGVELHPFSVPDYLLRIADFSRLGARKCTSRLELLQSPAKRAVVFDDGPIADEITLIKDKGRFAGCGFVSDDMMEQICLSAGMTRGEAKSRVALQVRILSQQLGMCKGVLVRKRIPSGHPQILIPESMVKVLPSTHPDPLPGVALLINKNGEFPSSGSANHYIGRRLDDDLPPPPKKSFIDKIKKPISDMVLRLWRSVGVPQDVCMDYKRRSLKRAERNHAWLAGVADPSGRLPPDTVYVPGMKNVRPEYIFVTRSPCVKHDDGRILQVVTSKPDAMTRESWDWLERLPFGVLVFSLPRRGRMSIPERIASGDLDGDLYLVCWDDVVLSHMSRVTPMPDLEMRDDGVLQVSPEPDPRWFEKAQRLMADAGHTNNVGRLTGALYTQGAKIADHAPSGLRHRDAAALFDAYKQALEYRKHGRPIELPTRLWGKVDAKLHHMLSASSGDEDSEDSE